MGLKGLSLDVFKDKYAAPGESSWAELAKRVSHNIALAEMSEYEKWSRQFYNIINDMDFIPGGRILFGAGRANQSLLNCFSLQFEDNVESLGRGLRDVYLISCQGGGIGMNYSKIRPKGDPIQNMAFSAPGVVSEIRKINVIGEEVKGGKNRRTALLAVLNIDHPDILDFLHAKLDLSQLNNFNISIGITDDFLKAVQKNKEWHFKFSNKDYYVYSVDRIPFGGGKKETIRVVALNKEDAVGRAKYGAKVDSADRFVNPRQIKCMAKSLWNRIIENAWRCGDPGLFNLDLVNKHTTVGYFERLDQPNPSLRGSSLVLTNKGVYPIKHLAENVCDNHQVLNFRGEWCDFKAFKSGEDKRLYKIIFSNGQTIYCTPEHKWPLLKRNNNYKRDDKPCIDYDTFAKKSTADLEINDLVYLPDIDTAFSNEDCRWKEADGFVLGWNLGDGWKTYHRNNLSWQYGFICNPEDRKCGIQQYIEDYVNTFTKTKTNFRENKGCFELVTTDQQFYGHFEQFGLSHKSNGVPIGVWAGNYDFIRAFVDGLFSADGSVDSKIYRVSLKSAHKKIVDDVQKLLSFFGLNSTITKTVSKSKFPNKKYNSQKEYTSYLLQLNHINAYRFAKKFRLTHQRKQSALSKILDSFDEDNYKYRNGRHYKRIKSIEITDIYEDVYDITVYDDTHTFMTEVGITGNCGEIPLPHGGSCCLGSINLNNMYNPRTNDVNWSKLSRTIKVAVRFLDDVLSINNYPISFTKEVSSRSRRIGVGVMGLHYLLIKKKYKYGSEACQEFLERLFTKIRNEAYIASIELAEEKGVFPAFDAESYVQEEYTKLLPPRIIRRIKKVGIRNATLLTVPPTGTTSIVVGVSSGIEPIFAPVYKRSYRDPEDPSVWKSSIVVDRLFKELYESGQDVSHIIGAHDVTPEEHLQVQATVQQFLDSSISKTINVPEDINTKHLSDIIFEFIQGLKGVTIYRTNSRGEEPLTPIKIRDDDHLKQLLKKANENGSNSIDTCKNGSCEL